MDAPKKRPSVKGKKKVGSADFSQAVATDAVVDAAAQDASASQEGEKREKVFKRRVARPVPRGLKKEDDSSTDPSLSGFVSEEGAETEASTEAGGSASSRPRVSVKSRMKAKSPFAGKVDTRKALMVIAGIAVALLLAGVFFVWNTYLRYDDAADIKGEWLVSDGSMIVVIDGQNIKMPDAAYAYSINDARKTITFTFAELSGGGSYDFSRGRKTLEITEGAGQDTMAVTTFYKVSDKAKAKPRKLSKADARTYLEKYAPPEQVAAQAALAEQEKESKTQGRGGAKKKQAA